MTGPRIPAHILALLRPLAEHAQVEGLPLYAVGGCVRDWILGGRDVADLDLVTEGDPAQLARLCARLMKARAESFGRFGTWRVQGGVLRVDFAAARQEEYSEPASLPKVCPAALEKDLFRRDFTINAMAVRLEPQGASALVDPYGGRRDLQAGVLRVLHPASFRDDPTRVFRAARFLCRFGLRPATGFGAMVRQSLYGCIAGRLSRHRIAAELMRILGEADAQAPLRRLRSWGYLDLIYPDLSVNVRGDTIEERLGSLVLAMDEKGEELLRSLPIEHGMSRRIKEALRVSREKAAPRGQIAQETARIVTLAFSGLPQSALLPLFLDGKDLRSAGLEPGPRFRAVLDEAARAQWAGRIRSRRQALVWLARRAGK